MSYAHVDNASSNPKERWLNRLLEQLAPLIRQDDICVWSDQDLCIGDDWHGQIQRRLVEAAAAVLLISPAFLASQYIANSELPVLLHRAADQGVRIIPVLISPSLYHRARFRFPDPVKGPEEFTLSAIQSANPPSKTLQEMNEPEQNRALLAVAERLLEIVQQSP